MKEITILGGGLAGLSAADKLLDAGFKVTVLEKAGFLGGLAASFEADGEFVPKYYHHVVSHNKTTQEYLNRYNAMSDNIWKRIRVAIGVNGKLSHINEILGLLKFDYLNFYEKIRFGLFGIYTIFFMKPEKIADEENAENWLTKLAGKGVTQKIFYNLYGRNKFNKPLSIVSAKQFAFRLKEREIYDKFTFPQKGTQPIKLKTYQSFDDSFHLQYSQFSLLCGILPFNNVIAFLNSSSACLMLISILINSVLNKNSPVSSTFSGT